MHNINFKLTVEWPMEATDSLEGHELAATARKLLETAVLDLLTRGSKLPMKGIRSDLVETHGVRLL